VIDRRNAAICPIAHGMLLDFAADRVIQKYQTSTCEQLKAQRDEPKSEKDKLAIEFLRNDPQARVAFIDKIAAPHRSPTRCSNAACSRNILRFFADWAAKKWPLRGSLKLGVGCL